MSTTEQFSFATTYEARAMGLTALSGQLFASLCDFARLNLDTCRSVCSSGGLHWESVMLSQTPEQFVCRQADTLPWLAIQIAGYARGWMDIASATTANLSRAAGDWHGEQTRHQGTTLDGMARCARGIDAMIRALNPASDDVDGVQVARHLPIRRIRSP